MSNGPLGALFRLDGRLALVTGGSRGLGLQIAEALGEFGARIVLVARKPDELAQAVAHLAAQGIAARGIAADLRGASAAATVVDEIAGREGHIDILVNNAGATWGAAAEDYPLDAWNKVFDLNVTALFLLTQQVARRFFLPQSKGVVLNIASIYGLQGHPPGHVGTIAYNASKGAVVNLTRALAAEWGPKNIRVNALAPGYFTTRMTRATLAAIGAESIAMTPLRRIGGDADLKGAALLLASDAGGHITGQVLAVDGGATAI